MRTTYMYLPAKSARNLNDQSSGLPLRAACAFDHAKRRHRPHVEGPPETAGTARLPLLFKRVENA